MRDNHSNDLTPLACNLSPADRDERVAKVTPLLARVREMRTLPDGYALDFGDAGSADDSDTRALIRELGGFVAQERACCPFIDYRLEVARDGGPVVLSVRGSSRARPILDEFAAFLENRFEVAVAEPSQRSSIKSD